MIITPVWVWVPSEYQNPRPIVTFMSAIHFILSPDMLNPTPDPTRPKPRWRCSDPGDDPVSPKHLVGPSGGHHELGQCLAEPGPPRRGRPRAETSGRVGPAAGSNSRQRQRPPDGGLFEREDLYRRLEGGSRRRPVKAPPKSSGGFNMAKGLLRRRCFVACKASSKAPT